MRNFFFISVLILTAIARAETYETGTLRGFYLGHCSTCAYDNWTSHIVEGVARPSFNDYGPSFLDPQKNGFGRFSRLTGNAQDQQTLAAWRLVFQNAINQRWSAVDSIFCAHQATWRYDLVHLWDSDLSKEFYVLREELDSSYVDNNVDSMATDNVTGSFRNGWGLFVFNPAARRSRVVVQVVHPQDDFVAVPVAMELYLHMDAYAFMIAGAGREVCWDTLHPPFDNGKSFSDPSRDDTCPFGVGFQELFNALYDSAKAWPLTIQMHSYDTQAHPTLLDAHVSAGSDDMQPNRPIRDLTGHRDMVQLLGEYPLNELSTDPTIRRRVDQYVSLYCSPHYWFYRQTDSLAITSSNDLPGFGYNRQMIYSHTSHGRSVALSTENFVHVELDEYPGGLWTHSTPNWALWLPGLMPATFTTYAQTVEYYTPFVQALDSAVWYSHFYPDTTPPTAVSLYQVTALKDSTVYLRWSPQAFDVAFDSYLIYYDPVAITQASPRISGSNTGYSFLRQPQLQTALVHGFPQPQFFHFAVTSRDVWGNICWPPVSLTLTDGSIPDVTTFLLPPDSVELNWRPQVGDSVYQIYFSAMTDSFPTYFMTVDTCRGHVAVPAAKRGYFSVTRVVRF
jgi:hypothetical protein